MPSQWDRQKVLELANGFRGACVLAAGADLDLWSLLGTDRLTAAELAQRLRADWRATTILLDALAALDLLEKSADRYAVPEFLRPLLIRADAPGLILSEDLTLRTPLILPMLQHLANVLRSWAQLAWVVRAGIPAPRQASIRGFEADRIAFLEGMHALGAPVADSHWLPS